MIVSASASAVKAQALTNSTKLKLTAIFFLTIEGLFVILF